MRDRIVWSLLIALVLAGVACVPENAIEDVRAVKESPYMEVRPGERFIVVSVQQAQTRTRQEVVMVLRDKDTGREYLAVTDAGIVELPKPEDPSLPSQ